MTTQVRTTKDAPASGGGTTPTALGPPHGGIAAVLVILSWAALFFFSGMLSAEDGSVLLMGLLGAVLVVLVSQAYMVRAHTPGFWVRSQQIRLAPALAWGGAVGIAIGLVSPALYRGVDGDLVTFGLGCLAIATLATAQAALFLGGSVRTGGQQEAGASSR